jgi:hypothetical protein
MKLIKEFFTTLYTAMQESSQRRAKAMMKYQGYTFHE